MTGVIDAGFGGVRALNLKGDLVQLRPGLRPGIGGAFHGHLEAGILPNVAVASDVLL